MKKVKVNEDACIGCGACQAIEGDVFELNDDGLAFTKEDTNTIDNMEEELKENVMSALEGCPTEAIYIEDTKKEAN